GAVHPARRPGPVGEELAGRRRVRDGSGRALRQLRPGRAGRLRRRGDRLGAAALLRTAIGVPLFTVINPATEEPVATVPQASVSQTDDAIARAAAAWPAWRAMAPGDRARLLRAFASAVDSASEELASLEVAGSGHPLGAARWEAGQVRDVLLYYAAAPERLTALRIAELALEAGLPEGVFQVVPGKGSVVGQRLVDHPSVRKIVFTGSTQVGRSVMAGCAQTVKRVTLELGGKSANVVFADADLERAAATAPYAVFDNAGQDCCARSRILVEQSVLDRFMELLEPAVKGVAVGDPAAAGTEMGPLISAAHRAHVASYVPDGAPVAFRG